jgi:peptide/nickel transport system substrate-binding protein
MKRLAAIAVTCVAALTGLAGCGTRERGTPTLRAYLSGEPASLNAVTQGDFNTEIIAKLVGDTLVDFDARLNIVPRLADRWEAEDDGRRVVFHLHPDVRWHDGVPFTADDVAFTLEKVLDPASLAAGKRPYFETVTAWQVLDDNTIEISRDEAYARAVEVWAMLPILARHVYAGEDFLEAPANRSPVGTGPYRFVDWQAGSSLELAANPDYFGPRPAIPRIVFRPLPDPATRVAALLAGDLDFTSLRPVDRERIQANPDLARRVRITQVERLYVWYIAWNQDGSNPFFTDARIRRAMTQALDREGFVRDVLQGAGEVATSLVHPAMWSFRDDIEPWPFDRRAAAGLLDAAGWQDHDGDGLRDRDGTPFQFTLLMPVGNEELIRAMTLLQESLRTLGIEMEIRKLEYNLYRADRDAGQFAAMAGGWVLDTDPDCYDFWHSSQARGGGINYASYKDAEVDTLCAQARRLVDRDKRAAIYGRVQEILHRDQPNTFLAYRDTLLGLSRRLEGVEPSPRSVWGSYPGPLSWRLIPETP